MVYIETITIQGKRYKYLRMSVRVGKKMKKITIKCLGAVNPIYHKQIRKRKSNASIYVKPLVENEKASLEKALHSGNVFTKERAKIVLLSAQRNSPTQISEKIDCEVRKVRKAIKAFNSEGLKALDRKKSKGTKPKFSEYDKKTILLHFSRNPKDFKIPISYWTLPRFRKHLMDKKIVDSICIETIRQILVGAGAKLTKSKRWQYSPDKNFLRKREQ